MSDHHTTALAGEALRESASESRRHDELFRRIIGRMFRYFRRMVHRADVAEDLTQDTLLLLERSLREGTYDPGCSFNAWMWLKARTVFAQWCRRSGRRMEPLEYGAEPAAREDHVRATDEALDRDALMQAVERALGTEAYECFVLHYQGGLTHQEIGELLGRHRLTVAARLRAAHEVIRRLLDGTG